VYLLSPHLLPESRVQGAALPAVELDSSLSSKCSTCIARAAGVLGKEKVSTAAGTFDAWKIVVVFLSSGQSVDLTYWYADRTGLLVRYQRRVTQTQQPGSQHQVFGRFDPDIDMELISSARPRAAETK
jgi:hypothetical protein